MSENQMSQDEKAFVQMNTNDEEFLADEDEAMEEHAKSMAPAHIGRPLGANVLIRRIEAKAVSAGGIHIPDGAREKSSKGTVVAVGAGRKNKEGVIQPLEVKVDDIVYFGKYAGHEVQLCDETFVIMDQEDIFFVESKK